MDTRRLSHFRRVASLMLPALALFAALLLPLSTPAQAAPVDTIRQFRGYNNLSFAWGTLKLRNGKVVRAYLPTALMRGFEMLVPYYPQAPGPDKRPRPKLVAAPNVQWMRVGDQYWELMGHGRIIDGSLALRRLTGPVELFIVQASAAPIFSALGPNPVLSSPADASSSAPGEVPAIWYLRRAAGTPVLVAPASFASQVAGFLSDDPELARRVAAGQPGYHYENLESIIQQYNQRARR
jgi:hypothetical protein